LCQNPFLTQYNGNLNQGEHFDVSQPPKKNGLHRLNIDFKVKKSLFYDYGGHNLKNTWIQDLRPIANDSA